MGDEDHFYGLWSDVASGPASGCSGLDLYWTTRSDGCRYEYWSSDPGDNEYGILVRIDATTMTGIGRGRDDGLDILDDFENEVVQELVSEGWPRFQPKEESEDEEDEEGEESEDEEE